VETYPNGHSMSRQESSLSTNTRPGIENNFIQAINTTNYREVGERENYLIVEEVGAFGGEGRYTQSTKAMDLE